MTDDTIHTCSYECERPECIRAQRDELAARLTALAAEGVQAEPKAEAQLTYKGVPVGPMQTFADIERQAIAPAAARVDVAWPLSILEAGNWREVYIGTKHMRLEVSYPYEAWERLMAALAAAQQQPAEDEEIMVNTPYDVFTLPLQPSGLDGKGPRFVVHVPGPEAQAAMEQGGGKVVAWRAPVVQSPFGEWLDHGVRDELVLVMHRGTHGWKAAGQGHALLAHQVYVKNVEPLCATSHEVAVVGLSGGGWRTVWARSDDDVTHPAPPSEPVGDGCHCGTCTCNPNMTPAVRFDLSPAQMEGAIRDHLIRLGWTPPDEHAQSQPAEQRTEIERLREDAARYRWLRKGESDDVAVVRGLGAMDYGMSAVAYTYSEEIDGDDLDAAIDEAMERENERD